MHQATAEPIRTAAFLHEREVALRILSAAAFFIFFQAYLVAPLIPSLVKEFHVSENLVGLFVPAYLIPYGVATLAYGPLSDRIGRKKVLLTLIGLTTLAVALPAVVRTPMQLLFCRVLAGVVSGGIVPISLALFGDLFSYTERGRPLGWVFGGIAGGMAFGSTCGALLNAELGWRWQFVLLAMAIGVIFALAYKHRKLLEGRRSDHPMSLGSIITGYTGLLTDQRARRAYGYILFNGMFHSGVFSWLGLYLSQRYGLSDRGIGLALLGYGIPGLLLGPAIGRVADKLGRGAIIPAGILLASIAAGLLIAPVPLMIAAAAFTLLSLGYDMSHPLLAGIITSVHPSRRGMAMGMNGFLVFMGFGLGSLVFQGLLKWGFTNALIVFTVFQFVAGLVAMRLFRNEVASSAG